MKMMLIPVVMLATMFAVVENADEDYDEGRLFGKRNKDCIAVSGANGTCVPHFQCDDALKIKTDGEPDESELRSSSADCEANEFCCLPPSIRPDATTHSPKPTSAIPCPWCAQLFIDGDSEYPPRSATGLFCGGFLINPKVVVTTAGCIVAAARRKIYIRFLTGRPDTKYSVGKVVKHSKFNSGTRAFDFALIKLDNVAAGVGIAPIVFNKSLSGMCQAVGYDSNDKVVMTRLSVEEGKCNLGEFIDSSCGHTDGSCNVMYGAPVLCPTTDGDVTIPGLVRDKCQKGLALMGAFEKKLVRNWILSQLKVLLV